MSKKDVALFKNMAKKDAALFRLENSALLRCAGKDKYGSGLHWHSYIGQKKM